MVLKKGGLGFFFPKTNPNRFQIFSFLFFLFKKTSGEILFFLPIFLNPKMPKNFFLDKKKTGGDFFSTPRGIWPMENSPQKKGEGWKTFGK